MFIRQRATMQLILEITDILRSVQSCLGLSIFELPHIKVAAGSKGFTGKFLSQTDQRLDEFTQ